MPTAPTGGAMAFRLMRQADGMARHERAVVSAPVLDWPTSALPAA